MSYQQYQEYQQQQQQQQQQYHLFYQLKNCCLTKLTNKQYKALCENLWKEYETYFNYSICSSIFIPMLANENNNFKG